MAVRPLVSAIIPTRNRATLLPRALDSVYAQQGVGDQFELEVVVVDDASSDATPDVLRRYPGIRHIRLAAPRGAAAARNAGIAASAGTLVAFLDDDDEWLPHRLSVQVAALEGHPEAGAVYSQIRYAPSGVEWPDPARAPSGRIFDTLLDGNLLTTHSVLIRRRALDEAGLFDESLRTYEDWDLWLRLSFSFSFLFIPGAVAVYHLTPRGSWSTHAVGSGAEDAARVVEKALEMVPESRASAERKRVARARAALYAADPLVEMGDISQAWPMIMAALRAHPRMAGDDWAQSYLTRVACQRIVAAAPVPAARQCCAQIDAAVRAPGVTERQVPRQTVADIWLAIARSLAFEPPTSTTAATYVAARALAYAPSYRSAKLLARVTARGILGRGAEAWCVGLYRRLTRSA